MVSHEFASNDALHLSSSLGKTAVPPEIFIDALEGFRDRFNMNSYDLLKNNCNNFTNEVWSYRLLASKG